MKVFLSCIISVTVLSVALLAADKKTGNKQKLSPGDKVEVEWAGKKVTATFVEYFGNGWITVKFNSNGITMTPTKSSVKPNWPRAGCIDPTRISDWIAVRTVPAARMLIAAARVSRASS